MSAFYWISMDDKAYLRDDFEEEFVIPQLVDHKYPVDNLPLKEPDLRDQTYFVCDLVKAVALTIFPEAEMEELSNQLHVSTLENAKRLPIWTKFGLGFVAN